MAFSPVVLFVVLGIVAVVPAGYIKSPFFNYHSSFPLAPITIVIMWVLAGIVYCVGQWVTERPVKRPQ